MSIPRNGDSPGLFVLDSTLAGRAKATRRNHHQC